MEKRQIQEILGCILVAFTIALVIYFFGVLIFQGGDFRGVFFRTNNNTNEIQNSDTAVNTTPIQNQETVQENNTLINTNSDNEIINIPMSPLKNLSGMTKEEILNLRKEAMRTSPIFSKMNYVPSSSVYRIDDSMPWISMYGELHWSSATEKQKINGVSRDSLGILNPELLYYIHPVDYYKKSDYVYLYKTYNFLPYKVTYNSSTNTITAYISNEHNENGEYLPITIADANAHDLGYRYAYMNKSKNVGFYKDGNYANNTLKTEIKPVTGWYMHGPACGIPGGCNNYAPYWQYYNHFYLKALPARFNIKLWKNKPENVEQEADINFKMVFK